MSKHSKIGIKGEQIAADFLLNKGYFVVCRNWRSGKKEIDIIALEKDTLVIAEIKTRSGVNFGFPEEAVNRKKQQFLKAAAAAFSAENPRYINIRYDIISIVMDGNDVKEIVHFEEAFH
jgi:putative endonuclease